MARGLELESCARMLIGKDKATITNATRVEKDALFTEGNPCEQFNLTAIEIRCLHRQRPDVNAYAAKIDNIDLRSYVGYGSGRTNFRLCAIRTPPRFVIYWSLSG